MLSCQESAEASKSLHLRISRPSASPARDHLVLADFGASWAAKPSRAPVGSSRAMPFSCGCGDGVLPKQEHRLPGVVDSLPEAAVST